MKDIKTFFSNANGLKAFINTGNVLSVIITMICAGIAYFGGDVRPDAVSNVLVALNSKQVFAIIAAIVVNIVTPLAYIFVKRPKHEPWWGFIRSRNFGVNALNLVFLGFATLGFKVPENAAIDIWVAVEDRNWSALAAVVATSAWGLLSGWFSKKFKDTQPPAAAPIVPKIPTAEELAAMQERASYQKWRAGQDVETR